MRSFIQTDLFPNAPFSGDFNAAAKDVARDLKENGAAHFLFGKPKGAETFMLFPMHETSALSLGECLVIQELKPWDRPRLPYKVGSSEVELAIYKGLFSISLVVPSDEGAQILIAKGFTMRRMKGIIRQLADKLIELGILSPYAQHIFVGVHDYPQYAYTIEASPGDPLPLSLLMTPADPCLSESFDTFWAGSEIFSSSTLWYPSSALDLQPLTILTPKRCKAVGIPSPNFSVFTCVGYSPFIDLIQGRSTNFPPEYSQFPCTIEEVVPVRLNPTVVRKHVLDDCRFDSNEKNHLTGGLDAALLTIAIEPRDEPAFLTRLILLDMSNKAFEQQIVLAGLFNPTFYCSIRDGCGFGGNKRCEADLVHVRDLIRTRIFLPRFWITDHIKAGQNVMHTARRDKSTGLVLSADSVRTPDFRLKNTSLSQDPEVFEMLLDSDQEGDGSPI